MNCSSSRLMRIITGALAFFASSAGIIMRNAAGNLAAESAAGIFADENYVFDIDIQPARNRGQVCAVLCVPVCI